MDGIPRDILRLRLCMNPRGNVRYGVEFHYLWQGHQSSLPKIASLLRPAADRNLSWRERLRAHREHWKTYEALTSRRLYRTVGDHRCVRAKSAGVPIHRN